MPDSVAARPRRSHHGWGAAMLAVLLAPACASEAAPQVRLPPDGGLADSTFAALVDRISEPGGYFDTDNLISNESSYLKVMDALTELGTGGAYVGVGPDQSYSYVARLRPEVAFIVDIRRDNLLHHLLLKALVERAPTRVGFLAGLHGKPPPAEAAEWRGADVEAIVAYVDSVPRDAGLVERLSAEIDEAVRSFGVPLSEGDLATIRRFHRTFIDAGLGLRFNTFGRAPRPYYPTYRQLVLETDRSGEPASYLASAEAYEAVRELHLANRIVPVVGDLAGAHAVREIGAVLREAGVELSAFYTSNVEFYLWGDGTFERWRANLETLPARDGAVVIRSYFPSFGRAHPSSVPGYYSTQSLQPVSVLVSGGFDSYWELVTREVSESGSRRDRPSSQQPDPSRASDGSRRPERTPRPRGRSPSRGARRSTPRRASPRPAPRASPRRCLRSSRIRAAGRARRTRRTRLSVACGTCTACRA